MEILPTSVVEYISGSVFVILGTLLFTYMLGEIAVLIQNIRFSVGRFKSRQDAMTTTVINLNLSDEIQLLAIDYFN